jgi:8-hydroxy-5-deazaflavin:NADPH oxidoreductase
LVTPIRQFEDEGVPVSRHDGFDGDRRALLKAGGALIAGAMLSPAGAVAQTSGGAKVSIGIIGSGHIGGTIGGLWIKAGHPVLFSSRHPEELKDMVAGLGPLAQAGPVDKAVEFGEVVFIAVPYGALPQVGRDYAAKLNGKIVLDACNASAGRGGGMLSYTIFAHEANRPDPKLAIPIAGDDPDAVRVAAALVRDAGFDPVVVGKLADARRFQRGGPGYGQQVSAAELKQKLNLPL